MGQIASHALLSPEPLQVHPDLLEKLGVLPGLEGAGTAAFTFALEPEKTERDQYHGHQGGHPGRQGFGPETDPDQTHPHRDQRRPAGAGEPDQEGDAGAASHRPLGLVPHQCDGIGPEGEGQRQGKTDQISLGDDVEPPPDRAGVLGDDLIEEQVTDKNHPENQDRDQQRLNQQPDFFHFLTCNR